MSEVDLSPIASIAGRLNLQIRKVETRGEHLERYQTAKVVDELGRVLFLKVLIADVLTDKKRFLVEKKILTKVKGRALQKYLPKLLRSNVVREPFWYLREYTKLLASSDVKEGFGFSNEFLRSIGPKVMVDFLFEVAKFGVAPNMGNWFLSELKSLSIQDVNYVFEGDPFQLGNETRKKVNLFIENLSQNLGDRFVVLSHNDLYADNIFFHKKGEIIVIDWEHCAFSNFLFDPVQIYIQAWRNSDWQSDFKNVVFGSYQKQMLHLLKGVTKDLFVRNWDTARLYWSFRYLGHTKHAMTMSRIRIDAFVDYLKREIKSVIDFRK